MRGSELSFRNLNCQREVDREVQIRGEEGLSLGCGNRQDLERTRRVEGGLVGAFDWLTQRVDKGSPKRASRCTDEETEARRGERQAQNPHLQTPHAGLFLLFYGLGLPLTPQVYLGPERGRDRLKITQQILCFSRQPLPVILNVE